MPTELPHRARPVFFDLYRLRFPVMAWVSIAHRVSGVVLALSIPALVYLLQCSITSPQGFARVVAAFHLVWVRSIAVLFIWALTHHVLAGIRHLLFDIHVGTGLPVARISAWMVLAAELVIVILGIGALA